MPYTRSAAGLRARRAIEFRTRASRNSSQMGTRAAPLLEDAVVPGDTDCDAPGVAEWGIGRPPIVRDRQANRGAKWEATSTRKPPVGSQARKLAESGFSVD